MNDHNTVLDKNRDYLIKQSEMLQAIISRMASNSLAIKQLGLTIWTTLVGFGFANQLKSLFILSMISFTTLCFLDGYYLYLEKRFRNNFDQLTEVICSPGGTSSDKLQQFKVNFIRLYKLDKKDALRIYLNALLSWANLPYLLLSIITVVILLSK